MTEVTEKHDISELHAMLSGHLKETGSALGREILSDFEGYLPSFKKVMPRDYKRMLSLISRFEKTGMSAADAELEAFYAINK